MGIFVTIILSFAFALIGCKESNSKKSTGERNGQQSQAPQPPPSGDVDGAPPLVGFLQIGDLQSTRPTEVISAEALPERINDEDSFYLNTRNGDSTPCLATQELLKLESGVGYLRASMEVPADRSTQVVSCMSDPDISYKSIRWKFFAGMNCPGYDFSSVTKQDILLDQVPNCPNSQGGVVIVNSEVYLEAVKDGLSFNTSMKSITSSADGTPCRFAVAGNIATFDSSCSDYSSITHTFSSNSTPPQTSYTEVKYKGVTFRVGDFQSAFYQSGQIEFKLNNWHGTLTYNNGSGATWTAASNGQTQQGNLTPGMSLNGKQNNSPKFLRLPGPIP